VHFHRLVLGAVLAVLMFAAPLAAEAQQKQKVPRIGVLELADGPAIIQEALRQGLRDLGYVEGQNIVLESRSTAGRQDRLPELAAELLRLRVDVIASGTTQAIQAVRRVNTTIPIVMTSISDPIGSGLVASLAHPGGNTTGVTLLSTELSGKRLEILKEMVPPILTSDGSPLRADEVIQ
jgi:putative ABC transport system substrate-binding protein